jgi:formylglycine-generating enzyme required for sulfatase activity
MILVERLPASDSFYIDSTEVTVRQYLEFLAATGDEVGCQPSVCGWNTSFSPAPGEVTALSDLPMHYVDWCDAAAYCAWAGKRLCGRIGGGAVPTASADDYDLSEWVAACGGPNYNWHPSLDTSGEPAVECNDWTSSRAPAGSTCEGSYPGLFDMQGNVNEWIDSCNGTAGATDSCETLGGNAISNATGVCHARDPLRRDSRYSFFGFRCCASTR